MSPSRRALSIPTWRLYARVGWSLRIQGKFREAEPLYRSSFEINDRLLSDVLNIGSESSKLSVVANLEDPIPALIAFQQRAGDQVPQARALAFEAVARRQGRVLDQVRDWRERLRTSSDAAVTKRFNEWESVLECQASFTIALGYRDLKPAVAGGCSLPDTELEGRYERLLQDVRTKWTPEIGRQARGAVQVLEKRRDTLEAALSRELPQFSGARGSMRLDDIRSHLDPDELFIEFTAYQPVDRRQSGSRYGAFLLDRTRDLRWVDLGWAAPIDRAIRDLFECANDWSVSLSRRENQSAASAESTAEDTLRYLSKTVLAPLEPWLAQSKTARRLQVAPDGMLTLLPFGALLDRQGKYLVERYAVSYVPAGRDLASPERDAAPASASVIALSPGAGIKRPAASNLVAGAFRADHLERLEGAEAEAHELQAIMPQARLLAEGQATEERVKELHSPAVLHIVGHGIVRGNEDCRTNPSESRVQRHRSRRCVARHEPVGDRARRSLRARRAFVARRFAHGPGA